MELEKLNAAKLEEFRREIDELADLIWTNLNEDNKISIYVRYIDLETGEVTNKMINKNA